MADSNEKIINDYLESLNRAMAIHAEKALEKASANSTKIELVEIVDITNRDSGWYIVWNGSTRYKVTSSERYEIGTKVYVTIPNGDFNQQKFISGLYYDGQNETNYVYDYELPFNTFTKSSENLLVNTETYGLLANCNKEGNEPSFGSQFINIGSITKLNDNNNYLGVAANFKTILGENVEGTYGLRINITATNKSGQQDNRTYYLRSTENMVGNIYNFNSFIPQQARFDIKDLNISKINVDFFQNGDFKDGNGDSAAWQYNGQQLPDNIFVKDIEVYYGIDKQTEENVLTLYTNDGLTYNSRDDDGHNQKTIKLIWSYKDLIVEDSEPQSITSKQDAINLLGENSNINIHWYKKMDDAIYYMFKEDIEKRIKDYEEQLKVLARWEKNWIFSEDDGITEEEAETIKENDIAFIIEKLFLYNPDYYNPDTNIFTSNGRTFLIRLIRTIKDTLGSEEETTLQNNNSTNVGLRQMYKQTFINNVLGDGWCLIGDDLFELEILPDLDKKTTEYMVVVEYGPWKTAVDDWENVYNLVGKYDTESLEYHKVVTKEPLVLINSGDIPDEINLKNDATRFVFDDDQLNGEYRIYDAHSGNLIDGNHANKIFSVEIICDSDIIGSYLNPTSDIVIWKVPKVNTRTLFYTLDEELENTLASQDSLFKRFSNTLKYDPSYEYIKKEGENKYKLKYQVAPNYRATAVNNDITCYVIQPSGIIEKNQKILFSQFDYDGSDYMFTLNLGQWIVPVSKGSRTDKNALKKGTVYSSYSAEYAQDIDFKVVGPQENIITWYPNSEFNNHYREIEIHLYNSKNREISLTNKEKDDIIKLWLNKAAKGRYFGEYAHFHFIAVMTEDVDENDAPVYYATRVAINVDAMPDPGLILKAEYTRADDDTNENIKYTQLLSLPVQMAGYEISGPTAIVYDSTGSKYYTLPQSTYITLSYRYQSLLNNENTSWENKSRELKEAIAEATYNNWKRSTDKTREALKEAEDNYQEELFEHQKRQLNLKSQCYKKILDESAKTALDSVQATSYFVSIINNYNQSLWLESSLLDDSLTVNDKIHRYSYAVTRLIPPVGYIEKIKFYSLKFYERSDDYNSNGRKRELHIGSLPIAVVQNRFNVPGEDQWYNAIVLNGDGETTSNTGARLFAAKPTKNTTSAEKSEIIKINSGALALNEESNKVSGTLIGTIKVNNGDPVNGLFGYNDNDLIFKIGTDGEAFLGKKGAGRISFSGNSGQIMSQSRVESINSDRPVGSLIDLKKGSIDLVSDEENDLSHIHIGTTTIKKEDRNIQNANTEEVYFSINEKNGKRLISIGDIDTDIKRENDGTIDYLKTDWGNYYIQTKDFNRDTPLGSEGTDHDERSGLRIDLSNGNFESYSDFTIMSSDTIKLDGKTEITNTLTIGSSTVIGGSTEITGDLRVNGNFFIGNTQVSQSSDGDWVMPAQEFETALDGIAGEYFQADWLESDSGSRNYIKNKPTIPEPVTITNILLSGTRIATINGTDVYAPMSQSVDLSNYYSKTEVDQKFTRLVNKLEATLREALNDDSFNLDNWDTSQWDD